jgi:hypothetical protein
VTEVIHTETVASSVVEPENQNTSSLREKFVTRTQLGIGAVFLAFQQSPGNEMTRAFVGATVLETTHNPLLVGASVGVTTMAIESASSIPIAHVLNGQSETVGKLKSRFKRASKEEDGSSSNKGTDTVLALGVGTAAVLTKRHLQEDDRTLDKDYRTIAKTAGGIAVVSAGVASLAGGGIEYADKVGLGGAAETTVDVMTNWKTYAIAFGGIQAYSQGKKYAKKAKGKALDKIIKSKELGKVNYTANLVTDEDQIQKALKLEQDVWDANDFGSLKPYEKYIDQSRIFAAFEDDECLGVSRIFAGSPELPPFIEEMEIDDPEVKNALIEGARKGEVEEYGTAAVPQKNDLKRHKIFLDLCRLAYRDATARDIKTWGIIMEPPRVRIMNKRYGFAFKQIGPEVDYQGGMCAPHIMDFEEVRQVMSTTKPEYYDWFVNKPL